jgi:hypothetical protein
MYTMRRLTVLVRAPTLDISPLEGGLFKRAQFREGAHTAHGNHRSKTIYRIIIGVCAFRFMRWWC